MLTQSQLLNILVEKEGTVNSVSEGKYYAYNGNVHDFLGTYRNYNYVIGKSFLDNLRSRVKQVLFSYVEGLYDVTNFNGIFMPDCVVSVNNQKFIALIFVTEC